MLNEQLTAANAQVSSLTVMVGELTARIESLEKLLTEKGVALNNRKRISKALGNIVGGKKSGTQSPDAGKPATSAEEGKEL